MHFDDDSYTQPASQPGYYPSFTTINNVQAMPPASYLQRLLAFGIDLAIFLGFWFVGTGLYHHFTNQLLQRIKPGGDLRSIAGSQLFYLLIFGLFILVGYGIYFYLTYATGQTLGCRVMGIRIVGQTGEKPHKSVGLLRYICYLVVYGVLFFWGYLGYVEPFFVRLMNGDKYYGLLDKPPIIVGVLLTGLVWAIPHLTMLFNRNRQSLYDTSFNLFVVRAR